MKHGHALPITTTGLFLLANLLATPLTAATKPETKFQDSVSGLDFVAIPAGSFVMGSSELNTALSEMPKPDAALLADETPAHKVIFNHAFYLSSSEVTQLIWDRIMHTRPGPEKNWQSEHWKQLPVVSVSWHDVQDFITELNTSSRQYRYRLPTEAEWEYAARAGDTGLRPFDHLTMDEYAWYLLSSNDEIQPVMQLKPNAFGLYDMYGNVWEWVADWYQSDSYATSSALNPQGPDKGEKKVRRGGSYHCPAFMIRSAYRSADSPANAYSVLGFRLVAEPR